MSDLLPKMKRIRVDPQKLYLDPNNPRFITREEDRIDESRFLDPDVIDKTRKTMRGDKDEYHIGIIKASLLKNGWQPVDFIFVRKFTDDAERYVVLEGNRRILAVKELLEDKKSDDLLRAQLQEIEVMEVVDKIDKRRPEKSDRELQKKISYLLGVRHHGSLKTWSPFAQAAKIHEKYLADSDQTDETFNWPASAAAEIAKMLSMDATDVKERLQVFRAMKQIGEFPQVKKSEQGEGDSKGGMRDTYYSVCKEVLLTRSAGLKKYISQDPCDFLLDDQSRDRIIDLCHFDRNARKGSPIHNPQQWRFLGRILEDEDTEKRATNLDRVEKGKETPENVWADREKELQSPEWGKLLRELTRIFQSLTIANICVNDDSTAAMSRVSELLVELGER